MEMEASCWDSAGLDAAISEPYLQAMPATTWMVQVKPQAVLLRFLKLGECPGALVPLFCVLLKAPPLDFVLLPRNLSPLFPGCHLDLDLKLVLSPVSPEALP